MWVLLGIVFAMLAAAAAFLVVDNRDSALWIALLGIGAAFVVIVPVLRPWRQGSAGE